MTSSSPLRLRTAIMVVSMIALPLVAVSGLKIPKFLTAGKSTTAEAKPPATSTAARAPRDDARPGPSGTGRAFGGNPSSTAAAMPEQTNVRIAADSRPATGSSPDNANYPVVLAANRDVHDAGHPNVERVALGVDPAVLARIYPLPSPNLETPAASPSGAAMGGDQFSVIQQRLRALGAMHYVLETWGSQGDTYRFQCRLSAGHHPNYTRHFEATDVDPLRAMQTVLADVEAWKAGRLP